MQNAGATYEDAPLVEDGNLLTARRPADLPVFTTALLRRLGLGAKGLDLPDANNHSFDWWRLGEQWGGSTKDEIIDGLNTAIRGERYALEAFQQYADKASDPELKSVFKEIQASKQQHLARLEARLAVLGGKETFQAAGSGAWATLKSWLQSSNDVALLRRALGDLQTGVVDAYNLSAKFTDPATCAIFDEIEIDLAKHEQRVADLYHARLGDKQTQPAQPTTGAAVSA
jgi:protease I